MKLDDFEESATPASVLTEGPALVPSEPSGRHGAADHEEDEEVESYGADYERTEKLLEDASMDDIFEVFSDLSLIYRKRIVIALKARDHLELGEAYADAWEEHAKQACGITP